MDGFYPAVRLCGSLCLAPDVAALDATRCVEWMTPVMSACVEHRVLWELTAEDLECPEIVIAADAAGVRFTATADAHFVSGGWVGIDDHPKAEAVIDALGLRCGRIGLPDARSGE